VAQRRRPDQQRDPGDQRDHRDAEGHRGEQRRVQAGSLRHGERHRRDQQCDRDHDDDQ
jgi:hypothetical protein